MPPPPSPWIANPSGMIRDLAEAMTNGNKEIGPSDDELAWIEGWGKNEDERKVLMDVIKSRIELDWPYNYKALLLLSKMPDGEMAGLEEKLGKLADSAQTITGFKHIKEAAKPLHEKAKAEIAKKEEEEAKKQQAAIQAMWGQLWHNDAYDAPALQYGGWNGWPYPYAAPPGVAKFNAANWPGKPPDGWSPYVVVRGQAAGPYYPYIYTPWPSRTPITALPQIYPFSRTGYYALQPETTDTPKPPTAWSVYVGVGPKPVNTVGIGTTIPGGLAALQDQVAADLASRGW